MGILARLFNVFSKALFPFSGIFRAAVFFPHSSINEHAQYDKCPGSRLKIFPTRTKVKVENFQLFLPRKRIRYELTNQIEDRCGFFCIESKMALDSRKS